MINLFYYIYGSQQAHLRSKDIWQDKSLPIVNNLFASESPTDEDLDTANYLFSQSWEPDRLQNDLLFQSNRELNFERDRRLVYYLFAAQEMYNGDSIIINNDVGGPCWEQASGDLYEKLRRRKKAREFRHIECFKEHGKPAKFRCEKFASHARILLGMKYADLRPDAVEKQHTLSWLAKLSYLDDNSYPLNLGLDDLWFYEQETGINLCVEIAAYIDKLFEEHPNFFFFEDQITDVIAKCISENFSLVAPIPAIDLKITSMKGAILAVFDVFVRASNTKAPWNTPGHSLENALWFCKNGDREDKALASAFFMHNISKRFNDALFLFLYKFFPDRNLFELASCIGDKANWCHLLAEQNRLNWVISDSIGLDSSRREVYSVANQIVSEARRILSGQEDGQHTLSDIFCPSNIKLLECDARQQFPVPPIESTLFFCDFADKYVQKYTNSINKYNFLDKKSDKRFRLLHKAIMEGIEHAADNLTQQQSL